MSVLLYPFNKNVSVLSGRKTLIIPSTNNSLRGGSTNNSLRGGPQITFWGGGGDIGIILFVHHSDLSIHLVNTTSLKLMLMKLNTVVVNYLRVCMKENNLSRNKSREIIVYQAGSILWWFDSQFWFNLFEHVVKQMDNLDWTRLLYLKLNLFLFTTSLLYEILQLAQQLFSWQIVPLTVFHVPFLYKRWHKRIKRHHSSHVRHQCLTCQ